MSKKKHQHHSQSQGSKTPATPDFVFGKRNYKILFAGIALLVIGFLLMMGTENILDFRKLTLAPIVVVVGFITVGIAILTKPKEE